MNVIWRTRTCYFDAQVFDVTSVSVNSEGGGAVAGDEIQTVTGRTDP